jgi:hypothetical protein
MFYWFQVITESQPLFRKATKLHLSFDYECDLAWLLSLSTLIDLSQLIQVELKSNDSRSYDGHIIENLATFIQQLPNVTSLIIDYKFCQYKGARYIQSIHSIIPHHVEHLELYVSNLDRMKIILEQFKHLSSITFKVAVYRNMSAQVVNWLVENATDSTYRKGYNTVDVWLGKKRRQRKKFKNDRKRLKRSDEHHDS